MLLPVREVQEHEEGGGLMPGFWTDIPQPLLGANGEAILDVYGNPTFGPPIPAPPVVDREAVRPRVDDVAKLCRTRTIEPGGLEVETFTDATRPTYEEVDDVLDSSLEDVLAQLPPRMDVYWYPAISRAIALRAASSIETSFYREQGLETNSVATAWDSRFLSDLAMLRQLIPKACYLA